MNKKRNVIVLIGLLAAVLIVGAGIPLYIVHSNKKAQAEKVAEEKNRGLGRYSEFEIFQNVPVMTRKDIIYTEAAEVGGGDYLITAENTLLEDYQDYLSVLEKDGFKKLLDNGEQGLEGFVYTSHYQKNGFLVVVSYIANLQKTTITATENTVLSERLYKDDNIVTYASDAKNKLHVLELESLGMGFIIQLKTGHFLVYDGGTKGELPYMIDYMESLIPEGQKPIIDAWLISHAHLDHMGILATFINDKEYAERVCVESVYFTEPSEYAAKYYGNLDNVNNCLLYCKTVAQYLRNSEGSKPDMYRFRTGEKYYFEDITVDVIYTPELLVEEEWDTWNSSSVVLMVTIEGQKIMLTGDSDWCSQLVYTEMYDKEYFNLTVYQVPHHGINVYRQISNRLGTIQTAVYPSRAVAGDAGPGGFTGRKPQNEHLMSLALESFAFGSGTKVLTFPYQVGTVETLQQKFVVEE